jgi:hypothetical protein
MYPAKLNLNRSRLIARLVCLVCLLPLLLRAQVQLVLDRNAVSVGDTVRLTVVVQTNDAVPQPEVPPVQGLQFTFLGGGAQKFNVNGVRMERKLNVFSVKTTQPGNFMLGPVKVTVGNQVVQSQTVALKVSPANTPAADATPKTAFLQLAVPKTEYYLGEVFQVEMNLFFQSARADMPQLKSDGFSLSAPPQHTQNRVRIGNGIYQQHSFRYAGRALKTGDVTFGPAECNIDIQVVVQDTDPFFGGLIQRYRSQPTTLRSEPVNLKILPLPTENKPASFNGAVGKYSFRAAVNKTEVGVGDPITISVEINGMGAWDAVQLPPLDTWRDFKIYPPNNEFAPKDELGIQGTKKFEIVVVPENSDVKEVPAMAFSYFDPEARQYQTIVQPAVPLKVSAAGSAPVQPSVTVGKTAPAAPEPPAAKDILHIKPHFGVAVTTGLPAFTQPWFWLFNTFPLLAWAVFAWTQKRAEKLASDPRGQRARAVRESEAAALPQLRALAQSRASKEFFDLLTRLLQERLGERLDLPASSITEAVVDERLAPLGVAETLRQEIHALFQACNQARYAAATSAEELDALAERTAKALHELAAVEGKR